MEHTIIEVKERFNNLPTDVQDALFAVETAEVISEIRTKYNLHIDQSGALAKEVGLVMLGFTRPSAFVNRIASKVNIPQLTATQITKDINDKIFNPIKESLKKVHELDNHPSTITNKVQPADTSSLFDTKLKGLFTSNPSIDPYRESAE